MLYSVTERLLYARPWARAGGNTEVIVKSNCKVHPLKEKGGNKAVKEQTFRILLKLNWHKLK